MLVHVCARDCCAHHLPFITEALRLYTKNLSCSMCTLGAQIVISECVREVLQKTQTSAAAVDILIVNCSLFSPTPSLCSLVINEFDMRSDVQSYNLSGMVSQSSLIYNSAESGIMNMIIDWG